MGLFILLGIKKPRLKKTCHLLTCLKKTCNFYDTSIFHLKLLLSSVIRHLKSKYVCTYDKTFAPRFLFFTLKLNFASKLLLWNSCHFSTAFLGAFKRISREPFWNHFYKSHSWLYVKIMGR